MTDRTPVVTWDGVTLGGSSTFDWELRAGTAPVERSYTVSLDIAAQLADRQGAPGTLVISTTRATLRVDRVYLIEVGPASDPYHRTLRFADVRWILPKSWVKTAYNVRRISGNLRLVNAETSRLIENAVQEPEIAYAAFSLNSGAVWTIGEILRDVLEKITNPEIGPRGYPRINLRFRTGITDPIDIENLSIDARGSEALSQVLERIPGYDVYVNKAGELVLFDTREQAALNVGIMQARTHVTGPYPGVADRSGQRPSAVVVVFTPEVEQLLRYTEGGTSSRYSATLANVLRNPDPEINVGGRLISRGSWVTVEQAWAAWGPFGHENLQVSHDVLRRYSFDLGTASFEFLWSAARNGLTQPLPLNQDRVRETLNHWRRTFQVEPRFHGCIEQYREFRVAIINPQRNSHAPAEVYSDWIRRPDVISKRHQNAGYRFSGWVRRGFNGDIAGFTPAPATVRILDQQAGIIRVEPLNDSVGLADRTVLGYPEDGIIPTNILGDANRYRIFGLEWWRHVDLERRWQLGVLLTVVPAIQRLSQFAHVTINPSDVDANPRALGPPVIVRVFPNVRTARVPYSKGTEEQTRAAIVGAGDVDWYRLATNQEELFEIAKAAASRVYEALEDRVEGGATVDLLPGLEPQGNLSRVVHRMSAGATTTTADFSRVAQVNDIYRFLSPDVRRAIQGTLQNPPPFQTPRRSAP